jgi:hypothetical protein
MTKREAIKKGHELVGRIILQMDFNDPLIVEDFLSLRTDMEKTYIVEYLEYCKQLRKVFVKA